MSINHAHLYGVILAGGSGTRFWPLSRERYPKQLLRIIGPDTLIQQTVRRLLPLIPPDRMVVVTNTWQAESITLQLADWKDDILQHFIVEPAGRNTAPAIGLAALRLVKHDPQAVMMVLPADHVIKQARKFHQVVRLGHRLADAGFLVTFGILPSRPETGYGYITPNRRAKLGEQGKLVGYRVARFVEKPDFRTAQRYVRSENCYWNSGIFVWKATTILAEFAEHKPALLRKLKRIEAMMQMGHTADKVLQQYKTVEAVSIDHGIMERSSRSAVIPADFGWSDVGSWGSLGDVSKRDRSGNIMNGNIVDVGSTNSVLLADQRMVATIGLSNMVVVDTPDATLVCPKTQAQDVKKIVEILKKREAPERLEHRTVMRPWGSYTVLEEAAGYKVKRIVIFPGRRLSLQLHHHRSEHWVVITGRARVTRGEEVYDLAPGESTGIPQQTRHRLENPGNVPLEIIEIQNGSYLREDDIVRFHDDYGRETDAQK